MTRMRPDDAVTTFARAYELDDFGVLAPLLSASCVWTAGDDAITGAGAIVERLRRDAEQRRRWFDELRREVRIEPLDVAAGDSGNGARAALFVTEYLMKVPGLWHRRHVRLAVEVGGGTIERIVERVAPSEAEAYERFLAACGIAADSD